MKRSKKEEQLFQNLLKSTKEFVKGRNFTASSKSELVKKLQIPKEHQNIFSDILKLLVDNGDITLKMRCYHPVKDSNTIFSGIIRMHKRGFGFVETNPPTPFDVDIFIPKPYTNNAIDGDKVEIEVNTTSLREKGPEGRVTAILERSRTHIAGVIREVNPSGNIIAYAPMLGEDKLIIVDPADETSLKKGDRIVMEITQWGKEKEDILSRFSHHLGHISDPSQDINVAIEEFDLPSVFPKKILNSIRSIPTRVTQNEINEREDFRKLTTVTIDPDTAKDFDDAISIEKNKAGNYTLWVHIADVSHYVKPGTLIDEEAKERSNSTYFPGTCLPMLPPSLSENLCSLKPNVNRLAVTIKMHISKKGEITSQEVMRSVIRSDKRFTYRQAKEVLDGKVKSKFAPHLHLMVELCQLLKKVRAERGSIEFALPEVAIIVNEKGVPTGTDFIPYDITHQMIEEFMLKANEVVATHLDQIGKGLPYRVHEAPAEDNMKDFVNLMNAFGFKLPQKPTPDALQKALDEALETPYGPFLAVSYIRRMRVALYSPDNVGHYGLGLSHYCHFTSPIRRYVDLIIHRILLKEQDYSNEVLQTIAKGCSTQERVSEQAEKSVLLLKRLRLLETMVEKDPEMQFEGIVTKVQKFGLFFEIANLMVEGFLHISELGDDYYEYEPKKGQLVGKYQKKSYFSGEKVTVQLKEIDLILLKTRWELFGVKKRRPKKKRRS